MCRGEESERFRQYGSTEDDLDRARGLDKAIANLDRMIDQPVYESYGLTEEEIKIVEGR